MSAGNRRGSGSGRLMRLWRSSTAARPATMSPKINPRPSQRRSPPGLASTTSGRHTGHETRRLPARTVDGYRTSSGGRLQRPDIRRNLPMPSSLPSNRSWPVASATSGWSCRPRRISKRTTGSARILAAAPASGGLLSAHQHAATTPEDPGACRKTEERQSRQVTLRRWQRPVRGEEHDG